MFWHTLLIYYRGSRFRWKRIRLGIDRHCLSLKRGGLESAFALSPLVVRWREAAQRREPLFSSWLSDEANQANFVKRVTPVMVVIGNPPYSGESANKGKWITQLMEAYEGARRKGEAERAE